MGSPARASRPATTPQMLKIEPIEMSICRQRITRVIPTAATSIGALLTTKARSESGQVPRSGRRQTNSAA